MGSWWGHPGMIAVGMAVACAPQVPSSTPDSDAPGVETGSEDDTSGGDTAVETDTPDAPFLYTPLDTGDFVDPGEPCADVCWSDLPVTGHAASACNVGGRFQGRCPDGAACDEASGTCPPLAHDRYRVDLAPATDGVDVTLRLRIGGRAWPEQPLVCDGVPGLVPIPSCWTPAVGDLVFVHDGSGDRRVAALPVDGGDTVAVTLRPGRHLVRWEDFGGSTARLAHDAAPRVLVVRAPGELTLEVPGVQVELRPSVAGLAELVGADDAVTVELEAVVTEAGTTVVPWDGDPFAQPEPTARVVLPPGRHGVRGFLSWKTDGMRQRQAFVTPVEVGDVPGPVVVSGPARLRRVHGRLAPLPGVRMRVGCGGAADLVPFPGPAGDVAPDGSWSCWVPPGEVRVLAILATDDGAFATHPVAELPVSEGELDVGELSVAATRVPVTVRVDGAPPSRQVSLVLVSGSSLATATVDPATGDAVLLLPEGAGPWELSLPDPERRDGVLLQRWDVRPSPGDTLDLGTATVRIDVDLRDDFRVVGLSADLQVQPLAPGAAPPAGAPWADTVPLGLRGTSWSATVGRGRQALALRLDAGWGAGVVPLGTPTLDGDRGFPLSLRARSVELVPWRDGTAFPVGDPDAGWTVDARAGGVSVRAEQHFPTRAEHTLRVLEGQVVDLWLRCAHAPCQDASTDLWPVVRGLRWDRP
ncbi:MAG: hypothetical protein H6732_19655 [Alphaproteobacteria bacterium]|nr:hypothetical protein [Alphaproteobacteria bacterium]